MNLSTSINEKAALIWAIADKLTLVSFAFMFLSYFFSSIKDNQKNYQEERRHIYENTCFEYLEMLEKVASDNQNREEI